VERLIEELAKLPGIGRRTAQRLAFHIMRAPAPQALALAEAIRAVKERMTTCRICFNLADGDLCPICADPGRDRTVICVVEEPHDLIAVERTGQFRGRYHVLGGALSPADGIGPEQLRIGELIKRLGEEGVREVIIATNPTAAGEATALHLATEIKQRAPGVAVTRLASGLPVGADLEYADEVTVGLALTGRRAL
jgi:recombination protein RecR